MLTDIHTKLVISSRRLILVAEISNNGLEAKMSWKSYLLIASDHYNNCCIQQLARGIYLKYLINDKYLLLTMLGVRTYLKCITTYN